MAQSIFIIGHVHYGHPFAHDSDTMSHVYGAVLNPPGSAQKTKAGLGFGTDVGFDLTDGVLTKPVTHATFVPIEQDSADRFTQLMVHLRNLHGCARLPYYFSRYHLAYTVAEGWHKTALTLEGETEELRQLDHCYHEEVITAYGDKEADPNKIWVPGIPRIRANCVQFFNFAAQRAGIDLAQLSPDWWASDRGKKTISIYNRIFNNAAFSAPGQEGMICHIARVGGRTIPHVRYTVAAIEKLVVPTLGELLEIKIGGRTVHQAAADILGKQPPMRMEPKPYPEYLQQCLAIGGGAPPVAACG